MRDNPESLQGKTQKPGGPERSHGVTDVDPWPAGVFKQTRLGDHGGHCRPSGPAPPHG